MRRRCGPGCFLGSILYSNWGSGHPLSHFDAKTGGGAVYIFNRRTKNIDAFYCHVKIPFSVSAPDNYEVFVMILEDSVHFHGVVESNDAPELSFDFRRIHFRATIISTMRNYLSKNSDTHPTNMTKLKIILGTSCDVGAYYGALLFSIFI